MAAAIVLAMPRMALPRHRLLSHVVRGRESARIQPRSCRLELSSPTVRGRGNSEGQAQPFVGGACQRTAGLPCGRTVDLPGGGHV